MQVRFLVTISNSSRRPTSTSNDWYEKALVIAELTPYPTSSLGSLWGAFGPLSFSFATVVVRNPIVAPVVTALPSTCQDMTRVEDRMDEL